MSSALLGTALATAVAMVSLWAFTVWRRDASLVDRYWGAGFVVIAAAAYLLASGYPTRKLFVLSMVALWGLRLAAYLSYRNWGGGEDPRYRKMRANWGTRFWWVSLFTVFLLQGVLMWIVSLPVQVAMSQPRPSMLTWIDALGVVVFSIGLFFEVVGDWQLHRFISNRESPNELLDTGLWRYTRHPNYFGDATVWWGLWLVSAQTMAGLATIFAPLLMTFLLLRVSGVAMTEKRLVNNKRGYEAYRERTSAFLPLPPKPLPRDHVRDRR